MRLLVTGGTGVLGRAFLPLAEAERHQVRAPGRAELDLFDPAAAGAAMSGVDAVMHLATRIQPVGMLRQPEAWRENDRLRAGASAILVGAALAAEVTVYIQPTVTFVYPDGQRVSEETPVREDVPAVLRSALAAEEQAARFAVAGRHGVVLRLGGGYRLGPGALIIELHYEYTPVDHLITGDDNTAHLALQLGYTLFL